MEEIIVDRAEVIEIRGKWYVKGYLDGTEVVTVGGWDTMDEHANATLYDAAGNEVEHKIKEPSPALSDTDALIIAFAELADALNVPMDTLSEPVRERLEEKLDAARLREVTIVDERRREDTVTLEPGAPGAKESREL